MRERQFQKRHFFISKRKREIVHKEQSLSFFLDLFIIEFYIQAVIHFLYSSVTRYNSMEWVISIFEL